jgi:hypothetical protein
MNLLFVNGTEPACGVYQYGENLWEILRESTRCQWSCCKPQDMESLGLAARSSDARFILYNWQKGMGGFLSGAPFAWRIPQGLVYHDCDIDDSRWDAIFFSDTTMQPHGKWIPIGRPLPKFNIPRVGRCLHEAPIFGVHGFIGAWAEDVVFRVMQEFEHATVRLSLPAARFADPDGAAAMAMAERCRRMVHGTGIKLDISHDFKSSDQLLDWLHANDMNCYFRPLAMNWRGISSATDAALAVGRPIAINKCSAFRHLHGLSPSICIEDSSFMGIFGSGLSPLVPFKSKWCDPDLIRIRIEDAIHQIVNRG